jgi:hypothetical protein
MGVPVQMSRSDQGALLYRISARMLPVNQLAAALAAALPGAGVREPQKAAARPLPGKHKDLWGVRFPQSGGAYGSHPPQQGD